MQFLGLYGGRLREILWTCTLSSASEDSRFRSSAQVSTFAAEKFISHPFLFVLVTLETSAGIINAISPITDQISA